MDPMLYDAHLEGPGQKVPLIKDYNNITPTEIQNVLKILSKKSNDYAPKQKKRKYTNVNSVLGHVKKPREFPISCIKLQSESSTKSTSITKKESLKRKCEDRVKEKGLTLKMVSTSHLTTRISSSERQKNISIHNSPQRCNNKAPYRMPICVTLDCSDEEVDSETCVQYIKNDGGIILSDSEESEIEVISHDTCHTLEISIDEDDVQYLSSFEDVKTIDQIEHDSQSVNAVVDNVQFASTVEDNVQFASTVEDDVQLVSIVEDDVQSISTVEDDPVLQKWREELKKNSGPCIVVSSDDETVYELQHENVLKNSHFYVDNLKTSFECPVCLDNVTNCTNLSSTICGHVFCTNCISKSITNFKKCPTCNYSLNRSLVHPVYLNFI